MVVVHATPTLMATGFRVVVYTYSVQEVAFEMKVYGCFARLISQIRDCSIHSHSTREAGTHYVQGNINPAHSPAKSKTS